MNRQVLLPVLGVAVLLAGGLYAREALRQKPAPQAQRQEQAADQQADWKYYQDEELGINLRYPPEYGEIRAGSPATGSAVRFKLLGFTKQPRLEAGVFLADPSRPRNAAGVYDFNRLEQREGKYYYVSWTGAQAEIKPVKTIKLKGGQAVLVNHDSFIAQNGAVPGYTPGPGRQAALISTKGRTFPALVVVNGAKDQQPLAQTEFEALLKTIEIR
jgi:hypothetical protein